MVKPNSLVHLMLALLVSGLVLVGVVHSVYTGADVRVPFLGWRAPIFLVYALAAMAITAIARAFGVDLGESRASVSVGDDGDWDDCD
jgi:hypothetical protein